MIVCVCRRISDHAIRRAAAEGAETLECLQFELGVATQCGQCADCAEKILCEARSAPAPQLAPITLHRRPAEQMA